MRLATLFLTSLLFTPWICDGQQVSREFTADLGTGEREAIFSVGGNVDFFNSFVYLPWPDSYTAYQNLQRVSLINTGSCPVKNAFLSLNASPFWQRSSDVEDGHLGNASFSKSALLIWREVSDHVIHRNYPVEGYRIPNAVDLLTIFGYGICYNNSAAVAMLPGNDNKYFYDLTSAKHSVSEYRRGDSAGIIDTDLKSFYLNLSNEHLSDKKAVSIDRYLIKRTHHYGRQYAYDKLVNEYIAFVYAQKNNESVVVQDGYSLNYSLVPGERLVLDYATPKYFFKQWSSNILPEEVANGHFSYNWNESLNHYYLTHRNLGNLVIQQEPDTKLVKLSPEKQATLTLRLDHGFQTVFMEVFVEFAKEYPTAPTSIEISADSLNWIPSAVDNMDAYRLSSQFDLQQTSFKEKLYLRIVVPETESDLAITNFGYTSYFQISRLALPQLKCGSNTIRALFVNEDDVQMNITLKYEEKTDDVPLGVVAPQFPRDGQSVYGPVGVFSWDYPGNDIDIVNYEFLLTQDTLTELPLSPNFQAYTKGADYAVNFSNLSSGRTSGQYAYVLNPAKYKQSRAKENGTARTREITSVNQFIVNEEGFFNAGNTYFWKVRPLHSNGIWGPWSRYFSFTSNKVMPPTSVVASDTLLTWQANRSGPKPEKFEIYGSNEHLGFEARESNLLSVTPENTFPIDNKSFAFFRVIAVDSLGNKSEVSEYVSRPYPYLQYPLPEVYPNSTFEYKVSFVAAFQPYVSLSDEYREAPDRIRFNILKMPPWLSFDPATWTFSGVPDHDELKKEYYRGDAFIEFEFLSDFFPNRRMTATLNYNLTNTKPDVPGIDTVLYSDNEFSFSLNYSDEDQEYGDSVSLEFSNFPPWLKFNVSETEVHFYGTSPGSGEFGARIVGYDKYGDSTEAEIKIKIIPNKIYYNSPAPAGEALAVSFDDLPLKQSFSEGDGAVSVVSGDQVGNFTISVIDQTLYVTGDFCSMSKSRVLSIPLTISTPSSPDLYLDLIIEIDDLADGSSVLPYHPHRSDVVVLRNYGCHPVDVEFTIFDISGQSVVTGAVDIDPATDRMISIERLPPGIYVLVLHGVRSGRSFRLIKP